MIKVAHILHGFIFFPQVIYTCKKQTVMKTRFHLNETYFMSHSTNILVHHRKYWHGAVFNTDMALYLMRIKSHYSKFNSRSLKIDSSSTTTLIVYSCNRFI